MGVGSFTRLYGRRGRESAVAIARGSIEVTMKIASQRRYGGHVSCRNGATNKWCEFRIFPLSDRREREKKGNGSHRLSNRSDCGEEEKRSEKRTGEKRWREDFSKNASLHREGENSWRETRNASF